MGTPKQRRKVQVSFRVTMDLPPGVNIKDAQNFVRNSIRGTDMNYAHKPDGESVKVALLGQVITYA